MALGNWDTFAVDEKGEERGSEFISQSGVIIEIYKDWLYILDEKAWQEGSFTQPIVMKIEEGCIKYKDINIIARRIPADSGGVFVVAWSGYDDKLKAMIGCGVYGYSGDEWVGVSIYAMEWMKNTLKELDIPMQLQNIKLSYFE